MKAVIYFIQQIDETLTDLENDTIQKFSKVDTLEESIVILQNFLQRLRQIYDNVYMLNLIKLFNRVSFQQVVFYKRKSAERMEDSLTFYKNVYKETLIRFHLD